MGLSSHKGGDYILKARSATRHRYYCSECKIGFDDYYENRDHQDEHTEEERIETNGKEKVKPDATEEEV